MWIINWGINKFRNRLDLRIAFYILIIIVILYKLTDNYDLFHILVEFICSSLVLSMALIAHTKKIGEASVFYYIGYGFPVIFFVNFFHIMYANSNGINLFLNTMFVWISNNFLEYSVVILSILFLKYNAKKKQVVLSFLSLIAVVILFGFSVIHINNKYHNYTEYIINCWYFLYILLAVIGVLIYKNKDIIKGRERKYLYLSLVNCSLYELIAWFHFRFNFDTLIWAHILKYIAYYVMYAALTEFILFESYKKTHEKLLDAEKNQIVLNRMLHDRLNFLIEIRGMLTKSEMKYISMIESISQGIIIFKNDFISYANEASGYFLEGFITNDSIINFNHVLKKLNINPDKLYSETYIGKCIQRKVYGEEKNLEVYLFRIKENSKVLIIKDVTEKIKNFKLKQDLERFLNEDKLKNRFFSNISHELRTPINLIYSSIQLKELYIHEGNYEAIEKNTHVVRQNCLRLIRTINNFIDTNRLSEGYLIPAKEVYNIVELVEDAAQASVRYLEKVKMHLIFDSEEEEIYIKCDGELIQRVTLNLLSNSVKFGKEYGHIYIDIYHKDDRVFISIKNDGPAVPKNIEPYLFDKFSKINKALNRDKEGSGLGLYLCKNLIEIQGGTLVLITKENFGNEFLITFPYDREIQNTEVSVLHMEHLEEKVDIEFSDIYI